MWQISINQAKVEPNVITGSSGKFSNSRVKGKEGRSSPNDITNSA
jgi:hypothetical protein